MDDDRRAAIASLAFGTHTEKINPSSRSLMGLVHSWRAADAEPAVPSAAAPLKSERLYRCWRCTILPVRSEYRRRSHKLSKFGRVSSVTAISNRRSALIITRVSSLSRPPVSVDSPLASAVQTRARLVMLLEPGGRIRPVMGFQRE